jgi:hypothetical protein
MVYKKLMFGKNGFELQLQTEAMCSCAFISVKPLEALKEKVAETIF